MSDAVVRLLVSLNRVLETIETSAPEVMQHSISPKEELRKKRSLLADAAEKRRYDFVIIIIKEKTCINRKRTFYSYYYRYINVAVSTAIYIIKSLQKRMTTP